MNLLENAVRSVTGSVDKAILCVKKPAKIPNGGKISGNQKLNVMGSSSIVALQADLISKSKGGVFSFLNSKTDTIKNHGYHVLKVKYNPSKIQIDSRAGSFIQPGPGDARNGTLSQISMPPETYMSFELIFDEENHADAFMFEKVTNLRAGALVSDVAGAVKNIADGYTVRPVVEALIGLLTQAETRQVVFYWSEMAFAGEVVSVDATYTMFNPLGEPVRAKVRISICQGDSDAKQENKYWDDAFDKLDDGGSGIQEKTSNLLNFR